MPPIPPIRIIMDNNSKIFCPPHPPYEKRDIIRSVKSLQEGMQYSFMYNPLETYVISLFPLKGNVAVDSVAEQVSELTLKYVYPCKTKANFYIHTKDLYGDLAFSKLGVRPYKDGSWEKHFYLAKSLNFLTTKI